ncbi:MAG: NAD(P)-binding domain-containing protein [Gemmatimonadetes bacterium]|nr:NAD(P)-binding domain-containing protein [Gemmatimonadota bacterium]
MRIGILGTGRMATTLARLWANAEHDVLLGSRDPGRGRTVAADLDAGIQGGANDDAIAHGDAVLLTFPGGEAVRGVSGLRFREGQILVDLTNRAGLDLPAGDSLALRIQAAAPRTRVVKAFNTIHFRSLADPVHATVRAAGPYCGDDAEARRIVGGLVADAGLDPIDAGPLAQAYLLEHLALLWIDLAFTRGVGADTAFALLRREST